MEAVYRQARAVLDKAAAATNKDQKTAQISLLVELCAYRGDSALVAEACKALGIVLQAAVQASVCELADLELRLRDRRLARHAQDSLLQSCSCGEPGVAI